MCHESSPSLTYLVDDQLSGIMGWQLELQAIEEAVMRMFDVHELEDRITEVLQSVQETGETVAVTKGGEIIAHLVPASTPSLLANPPAWLTKYSVSQVLSEL